MQIRVGYELIYRCAQATPMIVMLSVHYSRSSQLIQPDRLVTRPSVPIRCYRDSFGNWCSRIVAPPGQILLTADARVEDSGQPDVVVPGAIQHAIEDLPEETLIFLLGSRYCENDLLLDFAWKKFGNAPLGWGRVPAICDFGQGHVSFGYEHASATRTAWQVFSERRGVCRDFAHLAIALCRCMNIPARYCTGYLGDIGVPVAPEPMDFSGWFEAYLGGAWHTFDARHNVPRIGRVLIARGRDAADVAISTNFGPNTLESFKVWAYQVA